MLYITAKTSDNCYAILEDKDGNVLKEHDGYVPNFMPGQHVGEEPDSHYGDFIILSIDIETGKILNWKKPTAAQLKLFIEKGK